MLEVIGLRKTYSTGTFHKHKFNAIDDVSFCVEKGEILGVVGESGCGKSTLGRCILRLAEPTEGKIVFNGTDITALDKNSMRNIRSQMQMLFQDPDSSLDPKKTIGQSIAEPLQIIGTEKSLIKKQVSELMRHVGLIPEHINRYPHQLSGGQNQRAVLARALALEPSFIVADEPTASLDVSVQAQILNLLKQLKNEYDLTMIFISHDLGLMKHMSDRIAVMYMGKIVEIAKVEDLFTSPQHPFTRLLIHSSDEYMEQDICSSGHETGCHYYRNCPIALEKCAYESPGLVNIEINHSVACHRTTSSIYLLCH